MWIRDMSSISDMLSIVQLRTNGASEIWSARSDEYRRQTKVRKRSKTSPAGSVAPTPLVRQALRRRFLEPQEPLVLLVASAVLAPQEPLVLLVASVVLERQEPLVLRVVLERLEPLALLAASVVLEVSLIHI